MQTSIVHGECCESATRVNAQNTLGKQKRRRSNCEGRLSERENARYACTRRLRGRLRVISLRLDGKDREETPPRPSLALFRKQFFTDNFLSPRRYCITIRIKYRRIASASVKIARREGRIELLRLSDTKIFKLGENLEIQSKFSEG